MMDTKLKNSVLWQSLLQKKIYDLKNDMEFGEIPDKEKVEELLFQFEKANYKRVSLLKRDDEKNISSSFLDPIIFEDNGKVEQGVLFAPIKGALNFIEENYNSDNVFLQELAMYVASSV